ncbi:MAG: hypothetical protein HRU10_15210 [Opitutales bacterium]|nr:hypothetical protein [Opitutales bacterium]
MKTLKQRFSIWFNRSCRRYDPVWCDRFKSTVVEDDPVVLRTVAAYIDLNPVRAKLVDDPKDYRFCGYAEALAGQGQLRAALCAMTLHEGRKRGQQWSFIQGQNWGFEDAVEQHD